MHDHLGHEPSRVPGCARCDLKSVISAICTCPILPILGIGALRVRHAYSRCNRWHNAKISDGVENVRLAGWMNQTPAVILNIQRQPGANTIAVVKSIEELLPKLQAGLPAGVQLTVLTDRTTTIKASVADVEFELILTIGLVVMVIFVFLRNLAATIIPAIAIPISLVGTLAVMYLLDTASIT